MSKIKEVIADYKLLLENVPTLMTLMFVVSTIAMNVAAAKIIFNIGGAVFTGGFIISFMPFLAMDTVTRRLGARASIMLNVLSALFNVLFVIFMAIVAAIPTETPYLEFNYIFSGVWFIVLASTVAFVVSGVANSLINAAIGKLFGNDGVKAVEFYSRSFISTFIGQAIDNFLFIYISYGIFAPIIWGSDRVSVLGCIGTAVVGGFIELLLEVVFGPLALHIVKVWEHNNVGHEYIEAHKDDKL